MTGMTPSVVATLSATLILAAVYAFLYFTEKQRFLGVWALAWALYSLRFVFDLLIVGLPDVRWFWAPNQCFALLNGLLLWYGANLFLNRSASRWLYAVCGLVLAWLSASVALEAPFAWITGPVFIVLGAILGFTGYAFLASTLPAGIGKLLTGWSLVLWGVHKIDYPFLRPIEGFAPWGFLIGALLEFGTAGGMLLLYFEKNRRELAAKEAQFRFLAENARDFVFRFQLWPERRFEYVSPSCLGITGYTAEEHYQDPDLGLKMVHPDDREKLQKLTDSPERSLAVTFRWTRKDGRVIWAEQRVAAIRDAAGRVVALEGIARDVTGRIRAADALKRSEHYLRTIIDSSRDGILVTGEHASRLILDVNSSLAALLGHSRQDLIGQSTRLIHKPELFEDVGERVYAAIREKGYWVGECPLVTKDGKEIAFEVSVSPYKRSEAEGEIYVSVLRDLSERKLAEEARRAGEERHRFLFDNMAEGVVYQDAGGRVIAANPAAERILGLSFDQMAGRTSADPRWRSIREDGSPLPGEAHPAMASLRTGKPLTGVIMGVFNPVENAHRWLRVSAVPQFRTGEEKPYQVFTSFSDVTEHKKAEEALLQSEIRMKAIFRAAPVGIGVVVRRVIKEANESLCRMIGSSSGELLEQSARILYPNDAEFERVGREKYAEIRERGAGEIETRWLRKDGRVIDVLLSSTPIDPTDLSAEVIFTALDITERKRAEGALKESEERYRQLFDNMGDGVAIYQPVGDGEDFVFVDLNLAGQKLSVATRDEVAGRKVSEVYPGVKDMGLFDAFRRVHRTGQPEFLPLARYKDNRIEEWVENSVYRLPSGQIVAIYRDTSEQRRAEAALRESESHVREIIDNAPFGAHSYELKDDGQLIFLGANASADRILDMDHRPLIGLTLEEAFPMHRRTEIPARYREVAETGRRWEQEIVQYEDKRIAGAFEVFAFQAGSRRVTAFFRDVTDRKRAQEEREKLEAQLLQAQKMEAVGRLAGGVAHDFNNLLTSISGNVALAMLDLAPHEPLFRTMSEINEAADRAASLTRQLLAFSRRQIIEPRVISLSDLVGGLRGMLARLIGEDVEIRWFLAPGTGQVKADPSQIEQVVINLCVNARDAMPDGGKLTIETSNVRPDAAYTATHPNIAPGDYVLLAVSDTGHGMNDETRRRLFEPFFTTKPKDKGTGLGLAMSYGIVRQHGGSIEVYSETGQGTTFKIYLPRVFEPAERREAPKPAGTMPTGAETVLIVEDEEIVKAIAAKILKRQGYTVLEAASGEEALALTASYREPIDLLVTDVIMPGMHGRELAERLLALRPGLKVLYTSGYTENVIAHRGVLDEGVDFLGKPYSPRSLGEKVRAVLDAPKRGGST